VEAARPFEGVLAPGLGYTFLANARTDDTAVDCPGGVGVATGRDDLNETASKVLGVSEPGVQDAWHGVVTVSGDAFGRADAGGKARQRVSSTDSFDFRSPINRLGDTAACAALWWAASATARAPWKALVSVWVIRVEAATKRNNVSSERPTATPISALRMAGPLPAENTPLREGGQPSQSLRMARNVAKPMPAGRASNHQRSECARCFSN
jgi:hypothetical protein